MIGRNSLDDRVNGAPTVRIDLHTIPDVEIRNPAKVLVASWARRECTSGAIAFASISHIYTQTLRRSCFLRGVGFLGCTLLGLCGNVAIIPPLATAYRGRHGQVILQSATDHEATRSSQEQVIDGNIVVLPYRLPLTRLPFINTTGAVSVPNAPGRGLMYQLLFVGSLAAILVALLVVRQKRASQRPKRWMPDIRRVT